MISNKYQGKEKSGEHQTTVEQMKDFHLHQEFLNAVAFEVTIKEEIIWTLFTSRYYPSSSFVYELFYVVVSD